MVILQVILSFFDKFNGIAPVDKVRVLNLDVKEYNRMGW